MRKFYFSGKEGLGLQGPWMDTKLAGQAGEMKRMVWVQGSPDDGGETVNQELLLLLGDGSPLVWGFFLRRLQLFLLGVFPLWQLPGVGHDILSGLGKPPGLGVGSRAVAVAMQS